MPGSPASTGRRERNMRDKQARIFTAAASLFAERGFDAVSTSSVAERADVAAGTLFRYASSKGELLLMVLNDELRAALDTGCRRAERIDDTSSAIVEMIRPTLDYANEHAHNGVAYQRELLFGPADDHYRADGLALVAEMQRRIAARLTTDAERRGLIADHDRALLVANMVFAVTLLAVARPTTGAHADRDALSDIATQVSMAVDGYFTALSGPPQTRSTQTRSTQTRSPQTRSTQTRPSVPEPSDPT